MHPLSITNQVASAANLEMTEPKRACALFLAAGTLVFVDSLTIDRFGLALKSARPSPSSLNTGRSGSCVLDTKAGGSGRDSGPEARALVAFRMATLVFLTWALWAFDRALSSSLARSLRSRDLVEFSDGPCDFRESTYTKPRIRKVNHACLGREATRPATRPGRARLCCTRAVTCLVNHLVGTRRLFNRVN